MSISNKYVNFPHSIPRRELFLHLAAELMLLFNSLFPFYSQHIETAGYWEKAPTIGKFEP